MNKEKTITEEEKLSSIPAKKTERLLIYGVHPNDKRNPKPAYCFWASKHLMEEYPCVGDLVNVSVQGKSAEGIVTTRIAVIYVTDLKMWEPGDLEPTQIARRLYRGRLYSDFEYDIDE